MARLRIDIHVGEARIVMNLLAARELATEKLVSAVSMISARESLPNMAVFQGLDGNAVLFDVPDSDAHDFPEFLPDSTNASPDDRTDRPDRVNGDLSPELPKGTVPVGSAPESPANGQLDGKAGQKTGPSARPERKLAPFGRV